MIRKVQRSSQASLTETQANIKSRLSKYLEMHDRIVKRKNTILRAISKKSSSEMEKDISALLLKELQKLSFPKNKQLNIPVDSVRSRLVACLKHIKPDHYTGLFHDNNEVTFLSTSNKNIVFKLRGFPNLIFKYPVYGTYIRYYSTLIAKRICEDFKLNSLKIPDLQIILPYPEDKDFAFLVEKEIHANEDYKKLPLLFSRTHANELKPIISDLVTFMCITGTWDIAKRNFILKGENKLSLALIDLEQSPLLYTGVEDATVLIRRKIFRKIINKVIKDKNLLKKEEWVQLGLFGGANFLRNHPKMSKRKTNYVKDRGCSIESVIKLFPPKQAFDIIKNILPKFKYGKLADNMDYKIKRMVLKSDDAIKNESIHRKYYPMNYLYYLSWSRILSFSLEEKKAWETKWEARYEKYHSKIALKLTKEKFETEKQFYDNIKKSKFQSFLKKRRIFDDVLKPMFQNNEKSDFFNYLDDRLHRLNAKTDNPIERDINKDNYTWLKKFLNREQNKIPPEIRGYENVGFKIKEDRIGDIIEAKSDKSAKNMVILFEVRRNYRKSHYIPTGEKTILDCKNGDELKLSGMKNNLQKRRLLMEALRKLEKLGIVFSHYYDYVSNTLCFIA